MRAAVVAIAFAVLAGCASTREGNPQAEQFKAWAQATLASAESGQIKYSDYYAEAYDRLAAINDSDPQKLSLQRGFAELVPVARAFEAGAITKEQFADIRRLQKQAHAERSAAIEVQRQQAIADALERWNEYQRRSAPVQTTCSRIGTTVNCLTR